MSWESMPSVTAIISILLFGLAFYYAVRGFRTLRKGLSAHGNPSQSLWVVKGIRGYIVAIACVALGSGLLMSIKWLWIFGLIFLGEELLETGIMIFVLRKARKTAPPDSTA